MGGLDELRITFFQECEDLLDRLADGLRALGVAGAQPEIEHVHAIFRAVHSIKGGAGAFGLDDLVGFSHLFETVLDLLRSDQMELSPDLIETLLRAGDVLADLVTAARDGTPVPEQPMARVTAELDALADGYDDDDPGAVDFMPVMLNLAPLAAPDDPVDPPADEVTQEYTVIFHPHGSLYTTGNEPIALLRAVATLGTAHVHADLTQVRPLTTFDPDHPQLCWQVQLHGEIQPEEIGQVFDFVRDVAEIEVKPTPSIAPASDHTPDDRPATQLAPVQESEASLPRPSTVPERNQLPTPPIANVAPFAPPATIRVNLDRVDRLINLIGELVIMEAMLSQVIADAGLDANSDAAGGLDRIRQLASEIQESVMAIRAQPLRPIFQRMERIIRETSDATGKRARLVTIGDTTEVDKTVIERLVDPLTHMIRNAVDHGLEDGARRAAAGKPAEGVITLSAAHRSGRVIIEVSDDGGGIDRARVREIAETKGLISPNLQLSPAEIDNLLFMPGFSSKADVSAVSGRGVGLDVVRRDIHALGGRVSISSTAGAGTIFTIALPLTLAVLEGMLLGFADQTMVLPLSAIVETLSPASATVHTLGQTGKVVVHQGNLVPIIELGKAFAFPGPSRQPDAGVFVVVETDSGIRAALAAEHILDQRQVVIKSIEDSYGDVPGISAATILGDGRIALIIDPEDLVRSTRTETIPTLGMAKG